VSQRFEEIDMRAFLAACLAAVILAAGGYFAASAMQRPSGVAYTTEGARIDPKWSFRQFFKRSGSGDNVRLSSAALGSPAAEGMADGCDTANTYRWIFIDFSSAGNTTECAQ
jgi:hypothetical protein